MSMLTGTMMNRPLLVSSILRHADAVYGDTEVVSATADGQVHRLTYADIHRRARQLAGALLSLGVKAGDRVGTLATSSHRHLELYYGVGGMGAVCHTINPRLSIEQIAYIINHAEDGHIFVDAPFLAVARDLMPRCPGVKGWIVLAEAGRSAAVGAPDLIGYEDLLQRCGPDFVWPELDERAAAGLCYTSGTTGDPKGVLYSNRSTVLHAMTMALPGALCVSPRDTVMPVSPMFHVMAWGLPYCAPAMGAKLVLPGTTVDPAGLYRLCETEGVTIAAAVPTIWLGLVAYLAEHRARLTTLRRVLTGGVACPRELIVALADHDVEIVHAWGMTETSPLGTASRTTRRHDLLSTDQRAAVQAKQGRPMFGVEIKVVDGAGNDVPRDGVTFGDLLVRGPWVAEHYFKRQDDDSWRDGWFVTGDVATIDGEGYMQITDRAKDLIKSGGEWISSIELEKPAVAHPAVKEAAVIAVPHLKWGERPLLIVAPKTGMRVTRDELLALYVGKVAKWCAPDDVVFVDELQRSATGKLQKSALRAAYRRHFWPTA
jgi:acyl-CoA synthetase (AMP-forming)/AMP-acid ligase II